MLAFNMNVHILLDVCSMIAMRAFEWFFSGMCDFMSLEEILAIDPNEAFVAFVTVCRS